MKPNQLYISLIESLIEKQLHDKKLLDAICTVTGKKDFKTAAQWWEEIPEHVVGNFWLTFGKNDSLFEDLSQTFADHQERFPSGFAFALDVNPDRYIYDDYDKAKQWWRKISPKIIDNFWSAFGDYLDEFEDLSRIFDTSNRCDLHFKLYDILIQSNKRNVQVDFLEAALWWQKFSPDMVGNVWTWISKDDGLFEELSQNFAGRWETFPPEFADTMASNAYLGWRRFLDRPQDFCDKYLEFQIAPRGFLPDATNMTDFISYQNIKHVVFDDNWAHLDVFQIMRRLHCPDLFGLIYKFHDVPNPLAPFNKSALDARFFSWLREPHRMQTMPLELLDDEYFTAWFPIEEFFENGGVCDEFLERFMCKIDATKSGLDNKTLLQHLRNICKFQKISEDFVIKWREYDLIRLASPHVKLTRKILPFWRLVDWSLYFKSNLNCSDELIAAIITPNMILESGCNKIKICKYFAANPRNWGHARWNKVDAATHAMSPLAKIAMIMYLGISNRYPANLVRILHREMVANLEQMIRDNCVKIGALTREVMSQRPDLVLRACKFCSLSDDVIWYILEFFGIDAQIFVDHIPPPWEDRQSIRITLEQQICDEMFCAQTLPPDFETDILHIITSPGHDWKVWSSPYKFNFRPEHAKILIHTGSLLNVLKFAPVSSEFVDHVVSHHLSWLIHHAEKLPNVPHLFSPKQVMQIFGQLGASARLQNLRWFYGAPFEKPIDAKKFDPRRILYFSGEQAVQVARHFPLASKSIKHLIEHAQLVDEQYLELVRRFFVVKSGEYNTRNVRDMPSDFSQFFLEMDLYINNTFSPEFLRRNPLLVNWNSFFGFSPCVTLDLVRDFVNPSRDDCYAIVNNCQLSDAFKQECVAQFPQFMWPKVWGPR